MIPVDPSLLQHLRPPPSELHRREHLRQLRLAKAEASRRRRLRTRLRAGLRGLARRIAS